MRRPKSIKPRSYFPVFRERISCSLKGALNMSPVSFEERRVGRERGNHSRNATKSCLVLNQNEKERDMFVRYSHINSQDCS